MANTKIVAVMLLLLMALSILPLAIAEDTTDTTDSTVSSEGSVDSETQEELSAVVYPLGAEVRLLQLEKAITANILRGEEVVKYIVDNNTDADVTGLNNILDQMNLLLEEVKATPTTGTGEELAKTYVDLKNDAIELSKQFREAARLLIAPGERDQLRNQVKDMNRTQLQALDDAIKDAKHEYNAEQLANMLQDFGVENTALIEAVRNGTATMDQVKGAVRSAFSSMTAEQQKEAMLRLRESVSKKIVFQKAAVQKAIADSLERQSQRWEGRSRELLNKSISAVGNGQQLKSRIMEKLSERAQKRSQNLIEEAEQLREKIQEKLQERLGDRIQNRTEFENAGNGSPSQNGPSGNEGGTNSGGNTGNGNGQNGHAN